MAVKVYCSACDVFIKNADVQELKVLTGKEKCEDCGKKIQALYQVVDERVAHYNAELEQRLDTAKRKFATLDKAHNRFYTDGKSLYSTVKAELDAHLENILEGKSGKK